jgi:integrase
MPLKLVPPRKDKSPNWSIRGTYLGECVNRTAGTADKKTAQRELKRIEEEIERGRYAKPTGPTFADAALKYLKLGKDQRFIAKLVEYFKETSLSLIDQDAIDKAADELYPLASPATKNRQVYTPICSILMKSKIKLNLDRPEGANGERRLFWMTPDQVGRLVGKASERDAEFGLFLTFLFYTGVRLSEALDAQLNELNLQEGWLRILDTKNGDPRLVYLPPTLVAELASHPRGLDRQGKLFRFTKNGRLYQWLDAACQASGVIIPEGVAFHAFRHTWAASMRRYAGLDTTGLVATGAWKSRQAAAFYEHAVQSEEARRADMIPNIVTRGKAVE